MEQELEFNVDLPALLYEVLEGHPSGGVLRIPFVVLSDLLAKVAKRASELNDPDLNILMLKLKLYEAGHYQIQKLIQEQEKRKNDGR